MVARLIEAGHRDASQRRFRHETPDFFCQVGGYDLHSGQTPGPGQTTVGSHANLLAELSQCMFAFQRAMEQLGLSNNVTTFTASDFGRTFPCNGQGSDHGWGSHHLIMGGAVNGRRTYGRFPTLAVNGPDDTEHRPLDSDDGHRPIFRHAGHLVRRGQRQSRHRVSELRPLLDAQSRFRMRRGGVGEDQLSCPFRGRPAW